MPFHPLGIPRECAFDVEALEEFWSAALDRLKVFAEAEACERLSADERSSPTVAAIAESTELFTRRAN
jgi:hypothetical protein